jgi:hypothetical protein
MLQPLSKLREKSGASKRHRPSGYQDEEPNQFICLAFAIRPKRVARQTFFKKLSIKAMTPSWLRIDYLHRET